MDETRPKWTVKKELTARQKNAIPFLLTLPVERACDEAGLSKQTVYTWLKQDAFKKEIRRCRDELMQNAIETLKANVGKATEAFVGLLDSQNESIKHRTAKDIIEFTLRSAENESLEERIDSLEERLKELNEGRR